MTFLHDRSFWLPFIITGAIFGLFFAWLMGLFGGIVPSLPRPNPSLLDQVFTFALIVLLALNAGLLNWHNKRGTCPRGTKRASGIATALGAVALICPACVALPLTLFGTSISLFFLSPYVPLLRIIALILLIACTKILWPK